MIYIINSKILNIVVIKYNNKKYNIDKHKISLKKLILNDNKLKEYLLTYIKYNNCLKIEKLLKELDLI